MSTSSEAGKLPPPPPAAAVETDGSISAQSDPSQQCPIESDSEVAALVGSLDNCGDQAVTEEDATGGHDQVPSGEKAPELSGQKDLAGSHFPGPGVRATADKNPTAKTDLTLPPKLSGDIATQRVPDLRVEPITQTMTSTMQKALQRLKAEKHQVRQEKITFFVCVINCVLAGN
jgi:hypothetical protein